MCKMATKTGIKMPIYSILNRVPIKAVPKTPFELYKGWNSSLKHIHPYAGPLLGLAGERVETRGHMDLMTTFGQGKLSRSFTIRYLLVDAKPNHHCKPTWQPYILAKLHLILS